MSRIGQILPDSEKVERGSRIDFKQIWLRKLDKPYHFYVFHLRFRNDPFLNPNRLISLLHDSF